MGNQGKHILSNFESDKLDTDSISSLSLFLYSRLLTVLAKNSTDEIIGVHVYGFNETTELFEIVETDSFIQSSNTYGKLYVHNNSFCLIPNHLFDPSHKDLYLNFSAEATHENMEVFYESVPTSEIQVIGGLSFEILKKFEEPLPDLEIIPGVVFPLSYLLNPENILEDQEIFIFPIPDHIYIAAFSLGTLAFFNSFPVNGDEEFLKYTFTVIQQLEFNQENTKINLLGDVSHVRVNKGVLSPYFKIISEEIHLEKTTFSPVDGLSDFKKTKLLEAYWTL